MKSVFMGPFRRTAAPLCAFLLLFACARCGSEGTEETLFQHIPASASGIAFSNDLSYSDAFNIYTNKDFYAGGGVALGDVNNDGLLDVYLVANQKPNRLYLNKGDFSFEDITEQAGVAGSRPWSTGVGMADVNGDGLLDLYVANSGDPRPENRRNELFINNGDLTFTECAAAYGLADAGYSIHAAFFDYDRDGRLDLYLLNNYASRPIGAYDLKTLRRDRPSFEGGDRLYRNEGERFVDVTERAGIYSNEAAFGLGVSAGDVNRDGWMDLYVSNDFFERDYFYLNNGDGTFAERLEATFSSISTSSMGGDIADLDGDGFPEIFVSEMLPGTEERLKTVADFIEWEKAELEMQMGYHRQVARNTLQYNNGDGTFSEIGRYAGVEATDWSWGALMADFDLDGLRDLFVPNGFYKDVTDKDHLVHVVRTMGARAAQPDYRKLVEMTPTVPLANYMFRNLGGLRFADRASAWGLDEPGFSNGAAYGDLDRDGDLDLVINNVNMEASLYRNRASQRYPDRSWMQIALAGEPPNTFGVGAQVELAAGGRRWYAEQMPQRGFQSSMDPTLHLGLGVGVPALDSLLVRWPDGRVSVETDVPTGRRLVVRQSEAPPTGDVAPGVFFSNHPAETGALPEQAAGQVGIDWTHEESAHNDFARSPLLPHMHSTEGPPLCTGDADGDGREDVFVGGGRGQPGALFLQRGAGRFSEVRQSALEADRAAEDVDCEFVDVDGDGRTELYVASGSSEFPFGSEELADRLYRTDERGSLAPFAPALPVPAEGHGPTGVVRAGDPDGDGDQDLFVGTRMGAAYGLPVGGRLLENDGTGRFQDATDRLAPQLCPEALRTAGVTDAQWGDLNGDGAPDLVVAGEWMPLTVFLNEDGKLRRAASQAVGLDSSSGWWQSLHLADLNGDGAPDLLAGNHGLNSRFRAGPQQPVALWAGDFDRDRRVEQIFAQYRGGSGPYPVALRQHLIQVLPYLRSRASTFSAYAGMTVQDLFGQELGEAEHYRAEQLASIVAWNDGNGVFRVEELPFRAQLAPLYAVHTADLEGDGTPEILLGGNLSAVSPQAGAYDASFGVLLRRDASGRYRDVPAAESGFRSPGELRAIQTLPYEGGRLVLVARNDARLQVFRTAAPGALQKPDGAVSLNR